MKITDKKKPTKTIPKGVWEASRPDSDKTDEKNTFTNSTDLQGNGYPITKKGSKKAVKN